MNNSEYMKKKLYRYDPLVTKVWSKEELKQTILNWMSKNKIGSKLNIIVQGEIKVFQKIDNYKLKEVYS